MLLTKGTKIIPSSLLEPMIMGTGAESPALIDVSGMAGMPRTDPSTT